MGFLTSLEDYAAATPSVFGGVLSDDDDAMETQMLAGFTGGREADRALSLLPIPFTPAVSTNEEFEYLPEFNDWDYRALANGLVCIDPPNREFLPLAGQERSVLFDSYVVADSLDVNDLTVETIGVVYATALLGAEGRGAIFSLGGPGRPDMLSLDAEQNLWITEIKATLQGGRGLHETGLLRTLSDGDGGTNQLFENSSAWLQRSGIDVLRGIDGRIQRAVSPAEAEELSILRDRYAEAVRFGFASDRFKAEVIQVGLVTPDSDYLLPLTVANSRMMDRFIDDVRPERIVQVNVVEGAHESGGASADNERSEASAHSEGSGGNDANAHGAPADATNAQDAAGDDAADAAE